MNSTSISASPRVLVGTVFIDGSELQRQWFDLQWRFLSNTTKNFDHVTVMSDRSVPAFSDRSKIIMAEVTSTSNVAHTHGLRLVHAPKNLVLSASLVESANAPVFGIFKCFDVDYIKRNAQAGWDILASHRGQGLGRRLVSAGVAFCFEILNLERLSAEILADNERSRRCAEGSGFRNEGCRQQAVYRKGHYIDSLIFGILRSDLPARDREAVSYRRSGPLAPRLKKVLG
jgi:RimJ/RimL family protein N-acetyltransferase